MGKFLFTRRVELLAFLLIVISLVRIVFAYSNTAQAFDEPCHVSAAQEFLNKKTYTLDAMYPLVARIAIGIPLYVGGAGYPVMSKDDMGVTTITLSATRLSTRVALTGETWCSPGSAYSSSSSSAD
jgi:hypothetical protein